MLLNLIVSLVRIKVKSNCNDFLKRKHVENFYFQKQSCELLALNNIHVGAKLNRDQTINKFIQNTIEKASENRKNQLNLTLFKRPGREFGPVHSARTALGPSARQPTARPPKQPDTAPLLGHIQPVRRHVAPGCRMNPTVARVPHATKTATPAPP